LFHHSVITPLGNNYPNPDERNKKNHSVNNLSGDKEVEPELFMVCQCFTVREVRYFEWQFHFFKVAKVEVVALLRRYESKKRPKSLSQNHYCISRIKESFNPAWRRFFAVEIG